MLSWNKNWNSLIKPTNVRYNQNSENESLATVVIEPLERGFGLTLGNALRRVLLSSLQGASIIGIKIPGVVHEFGVKEGIKEDVLDIILNLKAVRLRMLSSENKVLRLKATGPCVVTAGMIDTADTGVDILNPDAVICTLSKGEVFDMDIFCAVGKGYVPAVSTSEIGLIPIDRVFSPVLKVSYRVEDTRVGQVTDYDKLVMDIETDGSISPEMAIALSAKILQDQLSIFVTFSDVEEKKEEDQKEITFNPVLLKKVSHLELSVRSQNCLQNDNIVYIGDLVVKTESEMLKTQNFGRKSLNEIKDILAKFDLKFGMDIPGWPPENVEELAKKYEDPY